MPDVSAVRRRRARKGTPPRPCADDGRERLRRVWRTGQWAAYTDRRLPLRKCDGGGATAGGPTTKQEKTTKQAGKRRPAPGDEGAEGGARRRPGGTRGWGGPGTSCNTQEAGRRPPQGQAARPGKLQRGGPSPGRSRRVGSILVAARLTLFPVQCYTLFKSLLNNRIKECFQCMKK